MNFKKLFHLLLACLCLIGTAKAQITVQASGSNVGRYQLSKCFDAQIVNASNTVTSNLTLQITLSDNSSNSKFVWKSNLFNASPGSSAFKNVNLTPQNGTFQSGKEFYHSNIYLGIGDYQIDYELEQITNGVANSLGSYNVSIQSTQFPAILLVTVDDGDTLTEKFPIFNWSAFLFPQPQQDGISAFDIEYSILIKEVFNNQSNVEAIEYNPTHHEFGKIRNTTYSYPFNGRPFADSAVYVWKVEAKVKGQVISSSEVWRFIYCPKPKKISNTPIVILYPERGTSHTSIIDNELKVGYNEKSGGNSSIATRASILNSNGLEVVNGDMLGFRTHQGFNTFSVMLCADGLDLPNGDYKLVMYTINGIRMELNFKYVRTNECE